MPLAVLNKYSKPRESDMIQKLPLEFKHGDVQHVYKINVGYNSDYKHRAVSCADARGQTESISFPIVRYWKCSRKHPRLLFSSYRGICSFYYSYCTIDNFVGQRINFTNLSRGSSGCRIWARTVSVCSSNKKFCLLQSFPWIRNFHLCEVRCCECAGYFGFGSQYLPNSFLNGILNISGSCCLSKCTVNIATKV